MTKRERGIPLDVFRGSIARVDLWGTNPAGERVYYEHKAGRFGEALHDNVTTGYGPESFTAPHAHPGDYVVQVNDYGAGRSNFPETWGHPSRPDRPGLIAIPDH